MKVAVVGAGIMGSCTALALVDAGHDVTVFDQFEPGHTRGSSHGRSRIIRKAYPDAFFTEIMTEGYGLWRELENRIQTPIVHECGLFYFGDRASATMVDLVNALRVNGVEQEELAGTGLAARFPGFQLSEDETGYWTREAGWVDAHRAVTGTLKTALASGASFVRPHQSSKRSASGL